MPGRRSVDDDAVKFLPVRRACEAKERPPHRTPRLRSNIATRKTASPVSREKQHTLDSLPALL